MMNLHDLGIDVSQRPGRLGKGGYRVRTEGDQLVMPKSKGYLLPPVYKDPELGILEPLWCLSIRPLLVVVTSYLGQATMCIVFAVSHIEFVWGLHERSASGCSLIGREEILLRQWVYGSAWCCAVSVR